MTFRDDFEDRLARVVLADSRLARERDLTQPLLIEVDTDSRDHEPLLVITVPYLTHVGTPSRFVREVPAEKVARFLDGVLND